MKLNRPQKILRFFLVAAATFVAWELVFDSNLPYVFRDLKTRENSARVSEGIPILEETMKIPGKDDPGSWSLAKKRGFEFFQPDSGGTRGGAFHFSKDIAWENNRIVFESDKYLLWRRNGNANAGTGKGVLDSVFVITSFRDGMHGPTPWRFRLESPEGSKTLDFKQAYSILRRWQIDLPMMISKLEDNLESR